MKNSGDGGPVGTLSEVASVLGCAGGIVACVGGAFAFVSDISETLLPTYLNGFFHGETGAGAVA